MKDVRELAPRSAVRAASVRFVPVAAVVFAALVLGVLASPEVHWGDSQRSFWFAYYWPDIPLDHHGLRIGLLAITRIFIAVLGPGEAAFIATSLFLWTLLAAGTFTAGRELFGTGVGYVATALVLFNPFLVESSTYLTTGLILPDVPSAGLIALGIAAASVGLRSGPDTAYRWLVLAGLLLAWAYLVREFAAVMFLALPVLAWARSRPIRVLLPTAVTMATVFLAETAINAAVYGRPLARLTVSGGHGGVQPEPIEPTDAIMRLWSFSWERPSAVAISICLVILVAATALSRDRRLIVCLVWLGSFWVALSLFGGLIDPVTPNLRTSLVRYWVPAFVPLSIGAAGAVWMTLRHLSAAPGRQAITVALVALVASGMVWYTASGLSTLLDEPDASAWRELRTWLADDAPDRLVADNLSRDMLAFYVRTPSGTESWEGCVATYWRGRDAVPTDLGGPILVSPTTPPVPEVAAAHVAFESNDGRIRVIDPGGPPPSSALAQVDEDVFVASRLALCE